MKSITTEEVCHFLNLVASMRRAQQEYFANRSTQILHEARDLERRVDAWLASAKEETPRLLFGERPRSAGVPS